MELYFELLFLYSSIWSVSDNVFTKTVGICFYRNFVSRKSNLIIGILGCLLEHSILIFVHLFWKQQVKSIILLGGININLLKFNNPEVSTFLDTLGSYFILRQIILPQNFKLWSTIFFLTLLKVVFLVIFYIQFHSISLLNFFVFLFLKLVNVMKICLILLETGRSLIRNIFYVILKHRIGMKKVIEKVLNNFRDPKINVKSAICISVNSYTRKKRYPGYF